MRRLATTLATVWSFHHPLVQRSRSSTVHGGRIVPLPQALCPTCRSPQRRVLPVAHRWREQTWFLVRCLNCFHRYTDPMPEDDEFSQMYGDNYFRENGAWVCGFWKGGYIENETNLRREAQEALALLGQSAGQLLEIGAAGGFFLDEARRVGFDVTGVELNAAMAEWGRMQLGVNILCGIFESLSFDAGSFDVIVAHDVLEHVRDLRIFVQRVSSLLKVGGVFFVRGPLEESWKERIYLAVRMYLRHGVLLHNEPPYHLHGFVRKSFSRLVRDAGLELIVFRAMSTRPTWNFESLRGTLSSLIENVAFRGDRLTGGGDFMLALAAKVDAH